MTDEEADPGDTPTPMVWALVVREARVGPPFAEAIVEIDQALHAVFVHDALDSGLTVAAGEPPQTSASVHIREAALTSLVLVGDRNVWAPALSVQVSPRWVSAAEARGGIVLVVVPPGTWPTDLVEMALGAREDTFRARLARAREAGRVLHGMARLVEE